MGIEIDLFFVRGSELPWFLCGGRKLLGFSVWMEFDLVYVGDRNRFGLSVPIEMNLVLTSRDQN